MLVDKRLRPYCFNKRGERDAEVCGRCGFDDCRNSTPEGWRLLDYVRERDRRWLLRERIKDC